MQPYSHNYYSNKIKSVALPNLDMDSVREQRNTLLRLVPHAEEDTIMQTVNLLESLIDAGEHCPATEIEAPYDAAESRVLSTQIWRYVLALIPRHAPSELTDELKVGVLKAFPYMGKVEEYRTIVGPDLPDYLTPDWTTVAVLGHNYDTWWEGVFDDTDFHNPKVKHIEDCGPSGDWNANMNSYVSIVLEEQNNFGFGPIPAARQVLGFVNSEYILLTHEDFTTADYAAMGL